MSSGGIISAPVVSPRPSRRDGSVAASRNQSRRLQRVVQQHRDGHRTDAAGDRRDRADDLADRAEIHVAAEFAVAPRFMPTSTTTAPGRTMSAFRNFACPMATTTMSAALRDVAEIAAAAVSDRHGRVAARRLSASGAGPAACRRYCSGRRSRHACRRRRCRCARAVAARRAACTARSAAGRS